MSRSRRSSVLYVLASLVLCILLLAALVSWKGLVYKTYFSPDTFTCKPRLYYAIPALGIRVTPAWGEEDEYLLPLFEYLRNKGFLDGPRATVIRWHFVRGSAYEIRGWSGSAKRVFDLNRHGLIEWSEKNPERAQVLWPVAVNLIRQGKYHGAAQLVGLLSNPKMTDRNFQFSMETLPSIYEREAGVPPENSIRPGWRLWRE